MKNKIFKNLFALALTLVLAVNFTAIKGFAVNDYGQYIFDDAGLLTEAEFNSLNDYARQISEYYQCGVHIITTNDESVDEYTIQQYSEDTYLKYIDFGWGEDKDGFMLVLSTYDRSYWLLAYGPWGNYALTDYGKDEMSDQFLDNFRNDDWYGGFDDYLSYANYVLDCASNGQPVDIYYNEESTDMGPESYVVAAVFGMIIAAFVCSSYKKQMHTAILAAGAAEYVADGGVNMKTRRDDFKYVTRTETKIETQEEKSSSRGGTTVNSRGFSGKGGKF